jgi:membrane-associated phospholipid phosphatase
VVSKGRVDLKVIPGGAGGEGGTLSASLERRWWNAFRAAVTPPAEGVGPDQPGFRPVDVLTLVYLGVTACLMVAFQANLDAWGALLLGHILLALLLLRSVAMGPPKNPVLRVIRDLYPLLSMAVFYAELALLTQLSGAGLHDVAVVAWEEWLFGGQPSQTLYKQWDSWILSQYLHTAYFAYYLVPASLIFTLYFQKRWNAFQESLTTLTLVFLTCCMIYIVYPVTGPYHYFGPPDVADLGGGMAALAHGVVKSGSSVGTAFPSSHTAVAVAIWLAAARLAPRVFWVLTLIVPALALATIYGGFHYAIDTLAGAVLGLACAVIGPPLNSFLARRLPRPGARAKPGSRGPFPKTG